MSTVFCIITAAQIHSFHRQPAELRMLVYTEAFAICNLCLHSFDAILLVVMFIFVLCGNCGIPLFLPGSRTLCRLS